MSDMHEVLSALPRDDWAAPRRLEGRFGDACDRLAFLLIRPDAVAQGTVTAVLDQAAAVGLRVVDAEVVRPHARQLEELYRYTQVRMMQAGNRPLWWYTPRYYELGPAVVVLLAAEDGLVAARELTAIKGPSNPALTKPGQIRYECGSQNMVMCVIHSSDSTSSMLREACLFFGEERVTRALEGSAEPGAPDAVDVPALLTRHGLPARPRHLPTFHQVLAAVQIAVMERPLVTGDPVLAPLAAPVTAVLRDLHGAELAGPEYAARTEALCSAWQTTGTALLDELAGREEDELVFLRWAALLRDTASAYADEVISRLRAANLDIGRWDEVVLETGWGFHDLIVEGVRPATDDAALAEADFGSARKDGGA
jgi:nucleoside diphosphate kinase